ncbi:hypothetical protein CYLTODRAFT_23609 [Cylindrobasidium torrendii FP15055 ss-10]|uniref:DUF6697 domain-containing protein n=1 Tax=Cylindrobasidium torrendii FP15055 ss-10 TaxID=1314674 RepID=A0A0D7B9D8_9AGAR|nr:hypothetical protein CYLTODRAFT_23609 [Cylindrobasidium torrendii FP15055 ss-10]
MISRHSAMDPLNLTGRSVSRSLSPLTDIDDGLASPMPFPDEPMDVDNATPEDVKPPIQEPDDNVRPPIPQFDPNVRVPPIMGLSILNYLAALEDFHIDAERHQVCRKTRNSLSELYGGSPQRMAVDIVPGKSHDGKLQHWLFPQLEMNTFMPDKAGKHGFLFATRREFDDPMKVWKLWVGSGTKPRTWEYCGDYVVRETGELKGRLWDHLSTKSQKTWAKKVIMSYSKAKAKGNEEKEIASSAYVKIYQRIQERLGKGVVVTSEDVQRAFRDGDEHIRIMTTFCIGFDYSLIQHMSSDTAQGSAPTKERKKRATKGKQQEVVTDDHLAFKDEDDDTVVAEPPSQSTRQSGRLRDRPVKNLREVSPDEDVPMVHCTITSIKIGALLVYPGRV